MIVVPIVAAHGLTIPKTSSRAITSPAGTADLAVAATQMDTGYAIDGRRSPRGERKF